MTKKLLTFPVAIICTLIAGALWLATTTPLAAATPTPSEANPVRFAVASVADPGGRVLFYFEVKNTTARTWAVGSVTLVNLKNPMGAGTQYGANRSVLPNESVYWDFEVAAPRGAGLHESVWQVVQDGRGISPRMTCYIVVVPPEAKELRAKIQRLIDDFNAQHGDETSALIRQIRDLLAREGGGLIEQLFGSRCGILSGVWAALAAVVAYRWRGPA